MDTLAPSLWNTEPVALFRTSRFNSVEAGEYEDDDDARSFKKEAVCLVVQEGLSIPSVVRRIEISEKTP